MLREGVDLREGERVVEIVLEKVKDGLAQELKHHADVVLELKPSLQVNYSPKRKKGS